MKHWAFDLDGTLVDSFSHYFFCLKEIFEEHGKEFSDSLRLPALTERIPLFFEKHLGADAVTNASNLLQTKSNDDAKRIQIFDGLLPTLQSLSAQGSKIAIWTNRDRVSSSLILKETGLDRITDVFISGDCVTKRKPEPEGLLKILDEFKCDSHTLTMVGDHEHDVLAAKSVGARAVRASWHAYWDIERCTHADFQFYQVADFKEWISRR